MKTLLMFCMLLICFSAISADAKYKIKVIPSSGRITVICYDHSKITKVESKDGKAFDKLDYKDTNTGEYKCNTSKIFVKFRTCDNCVELDPVSISGLIVGNVVVTFVIGVSVYLIAKHSQTGTTASPKKGSDRQHLVMNEVGVSPYQQLRPRNGQRDIYDRLQK